MSGSGFYSNDTWQNVQDMSRFLYLFGIYSVLKDKNLYKP